MPPIQEPDTVHRIQHHLHPLLHARLLPVAHGRVLEHEAHAVVPHVRAHRDGELQERRPELLQKATVTKRALNTTLLDFKNPSELYKSKVFHTVTLSRLQHWIQSLSGCQPQIIMLEAVRVVKGL